MQSICSYLLLLGLADVIICSMESNVLNGKNLKVAAEHWPPFFVIYEHPEYPGYFMYFGVMEQLLHGLREALNFTTTMVRPPDGSWGHFNQETREWSGMIGMVYRNEVDFALGPFGMWSDRAQVIDFTLPVHTDQGVGLFPLKIGNNKDARIRPFDWKTWVVIASLPPIYLLIIALCEYVFNHHANWLTLIDFTLRPVFMQGVPRLPQANMYNRLLSITWIVMAYILGLAYLGVMTSMITSPDEPEYLETHLQAMQQNDIPWIVESGSALEHHGFDSEEGSLERLFYDGKIVVQGHTNITKMVTTKQFGWIDSKIALQHFISEDFGRAAVCNFYLTSTIVTTNYAMIFPKGSTYTEPVNAILLSMIQSGLTDSWISNIVTNASNCDTKVKILSSHKRPLVHLTLSELEQFFLIIFVGLITSVVGLLAEIMKAKRDGKRDYLYKIRLQKKRLAMLKIASIKVFKEVKIAQRGKHIRVSRGLL